MSHVIYFTYHVFHFNIDLCVYATDVHKFLFYAGCYGEW